jgi:PTS system fructose-specific IIC component
MQLCDIIREPVQVLTDMKAATRWEAIEELVDALAAAGKLDAEQRAAVAEAIRRRESDLSTGIGRGIGIPHAASDKITEFVGAFGRSRGGIDFEAVDGKPVHLVMLFVVPKDRAQEHLDTLANIARLLNHAAFRQRLQAADTAEEILRAFQELRT